ncbi:transcription factor RelB isoform X2 [Hyla sarda]|uniref:transcription factor RelB isoform X2 n=1 Tax=Hyla sarda TaxID=327740 RepID=UPI0024C2F28C|nr:transcription factor RelB isoform X2 [Hyla sarda]
MREPGRTVPNGISQTHPPTLEEVMDYITADSGRPTWEGESSILSTVTVGQWTPPVELPPQNWVLGQNTPAPQLIITEQPKQRGMRFRYQCEGRSAGSILGESSTDHSKTLPAIELVNCEGIHDVKVSVCLVWKDPPHRIHPHGLVGKDCHDGICEVIMHPDEGQTQHSFSNLGIQCVRKKEIESSVKARLSLGIDPYHAGMWRHHEEVDLNVVRLCFQAWYNTSSGKALPIGPVLSEPVYDKKSTNTSELKICRMNKDSGRCEGGEEIYILCDKVQKEDIQVMFIEGKWEARADFSQADVHRQIAIVLKTPPYYDLHIQDPAPVQVCLQRITDGIRSDGVTFTYIPRDDSYGVRKKQPRLSTSYEDLSVPDPHFIESKRKQVRPDYREHCAPMTDVFSTHKPAFSGFDYLPVMNMMGTNEPVYHEPSHIEDTTANFETLMSWFPSGINDLTDPATFDTLLSVPEDEATASLVGNSLALTGELGRQFPDCAFSEDSRMGGC